MYTEGEINDQKQISPPSPLLANHGSEAPPQPELLPPASASTATTPVSLATAPAVKAPSPQSTGAPAPPPPPPPPQLLKVDHYPTPQHHHSSAASTPLPPPSHHHQQHLYRDVDSHQNSDSDSSSTFGVDGNRRYREFVPEEQKDSLYWEKRRKNNEAARRSREKRRIHDKVLEGRINVLEDDNTKLRRELMALKRKFNVSDNNLYVDDSMEDEPPDRRGPISPPPASNHSHSPQSSPVGGASRPSVHAHMAYSSPPPLLAMPGAMHMGMAMYSNSSSGLPYFLSEATSRVSQEGGGAAKPQPTLQHAHPHYHINPHQLHPQHPAYAMEMYKHDPIEEGEIRTRERSNSNVERRSAFSLDSPDNPLFRRASVGNYAQYRAPHSPPVSTQNAFPHVNSSHPPYLQAGYDGYQRSVWSQPSPVTSHSSDDEPLQLTVRRDSGSDQMTPRRDSGSNNNHSSISVHDDSSMESEHSATLADKAPHSISPPASSFPLKLRHKLPNHDANGGGGGYTKDMFSNSTPSAPAIASAPFSPHHRHHHPFMNGLAHLADLGLAQTNPLSLVKSDSPSLYRHRKERSGVRRAPGDTKYLDPKYLERRRRNNEAARKCRENRKKMTKIREAKSDYLETENNKLRDELNSLQEEMKQLRELIEKKRLEQGIKEEPSSES